MSILRDASKNKGEDKEMLRQVMKSDKNSNYLLTIYRDIKGVQKIFREFFLPRPFETFSIILPHELASDARLSKKSRKAEVRKIP